MRIKKTFQGTLPENKILNASSNSQTDTYSCNYINELINDAKYAGATRAYRVKSDTTHSLVTIGSGDTTPMELFEDYKTKYADELFTLSSDGSYITVNKRCMLSFSGTFNAGSTNSAAKGKSIMMNVMYEDNDVGGLMTLVASEDAVMADNLTAGGVLRDFGYHLVEAGTKIYVAVEQLQSGWTGDIWGMALYVHCATLS